LHQVVVGRNDSLVRIPGPWLRAAQSAFPESLTSQAYRSAASRSGLEPLQGATLTSARSEHVMGLYRRSELVSACRRTLEAIRAAIPGDTTRARFDRIFRPHGEWIVDLHDAALAWARGKVPGLRWEAVRRSLTAAHWISPQDSLTTAEALPRALYSLAVLAATDSAAFAAARASLWGADSASATAVLMLLKGYTESQRWYADALGFFLREPWAPGGAGRSVQEYVREEWRRASPTELEVPVPVIQTRWFGYPQAVPRYGVPAALFARLVRADNAGATEWLEHYGETRLLRTLRWLPQGDSGLVLLRTGSETLRLTTVSRQSRENLNGFLEPQDAIVIDPGYSPLLALGAVVHEWQHLLFRRRQLERFAAKLPRETSSGLRLPGVQPYLAEGFAEWSAERVLAPLVQRWPLLGLGELEKRAGLVQSGPDDQHALGYALIQALAAELQNPAGTTDLLLRHAEHPSQVLVEPVLRKSWSKYRGAADLVLSMPMYTMLIPEVTFTIEDGFPDVIATRILVPTDSEAKR
jgi:hypothetical protein